MAAGIDTVHVPYKGEPPALQDLIGGQIDAAVARSTRQWRRSAA